MNEPVFDTKSNRWGNSANQTDNVDTHKQKITKANTFFHCSMRFTMSALLCLTKLDVANLWAHRAANPGIIPTGILPCHGGCIYVSDVFWRDFFMESSLDLLWFVHVREIRKVWQWTHEISRMKKEWQARRGFTFSNLTFWELHRLWFLMIFRCKEWKRYGTFSLWIVWMQLQAQDAASATAPPPLPAPSQPPDEENAGSVTFACCMADQVAHSRTFRLIQFWILEGIKDRLWTTTWTQSADEGCCGRGPKPETLQELSHRPLDFGERFLSWFILICSHTASDFLVAPCGPCSTFCVQKDSWSSICAVMPLRWCILLFVVSSVWAVGNLKIEEDTTSAVDESLYFGCIWWDYVATPDQNIPRQCQT